MRQTRLSEIIDDINPELRGLVLRLARGEKELLPHNVARLLGYRSRRRVDRLCDLHILSYVHRPTRRILAGSIVNYLLTRHGYNHIVIDLDNLPASSV